MVTMDKPFKSRERNNELAVKKHWRQLNYTTSQCTHYFIKYTSLDLNMQNRMLTDNIYPAFIVINHMSFKQLWK